MRLINVSEHYYTYYARNSKHNLFSYAIYINIFKLFTPNYDIKRIKRRTLGILYHIITAIYYKLYVYQSSTCRSNVLSNKNI